MDLNATQRLLAKLYTDSALRQRFSVERGAVAKEFGIAPDEARQLEHLPVEQLAAFARTLERKRISELRRALPATCRALGSRLHHLFELHAARFHPHGAQRHVDDAVAFARFLFRARDPTGVADLGRYEANWLRFRNGRAWPLLAVFRSDPRGLAAGRSAEPDRSRWLIALWFRLAGRPRHLALRLPRFVG
jgi:hypothetical protein